MDKARQTIIDSASSLFARYGYDKTTVEDIARRAHKAKASIYYYYDSKSAIMKDVLAQEMEYLMSSLKEIIKKYPEDTPDQMVAYLKARMELFSRMEVYKHHVMTQYNRDTGEVSGIIRLVRESFDKWEYDYFYKLCEFGRGAGVFSEAVKPVVFAEMLIMLLHGVELQFFVTDDMAATKSTYDAMLELLVYSVYKNSQKQ